MKSNKKNRLLQRLNGKGKWTHITTWREKKCLQKVNNIVEIADIIKCRKQRYNNSITWRLNSLKVKWTIRKTESNKRIKHR